MAELSRPGVVKAVMPFAVPREFYSPFLGGRKMEEEEEEEDEEEEEEEEEEEVEEEEKEEEYDLRPRGE
jgi:hypothetical protein